MNMIDKALGVHAQALSVRSRRMELLGLNIANSDTPNFKAKDVDFKSVLQAAHSSNLSITNKGHVPLTESGSPDGEMYRMTMAEDPHPALRAAAEQASRVLDIPVTGLDFLVPAVDGPEHVIIEANERPGLANHEPQPTAQRFVDLLFPQTSHEEVPA